MPWVVLCFLLCPMRLLCGEGGKKHSVDFKEWGEKGTRGEGCMKLPKCLCDLWTSVLFGDGWDWSTQGLSVCLPVCPSPRLAFQPLVLPLYENSDLWLTSTCIFFFFLPQTSEREIKEASCWDERKISRLHTRTCNFAGIVFFNDSHGKSVVLCSEEWTADEHHQNCFAKWKHFVRNRSAELHMGC